MGGSSQRTRDKWTGPSVHSVLCNEHFSQDCFQKSFEIGKSFGITGRRQLKDNAIPTLFKRKIDDTLTSDSNPIPKKRRAYEKKERRRVKVTCDPEPEVTSDPEPEVTNDPEPEVICDPEPELSLQTIGTQVERIISKNATVQTGHFSRSKRVQTSIVKCVDVGVQCDLLPETCSATSQPDLDEDDVPSDDTDDVEDNDSDYSISTTYEELASSR
uniref:THAP-type domain-containing protein n=1 Tax=Amphimedon queenslandica TaxID=400682 RepID=A0A1X7SJY4_AMPQE